MTDKTLDFIRLTRDRSRDNTAAIISLHSQQLFGQATAILRQELDSLIRVCYLLTITNPNERLRLIDDTLNGNKWRINNKVITDREMVNTASRYNHWAPEVYDFGNSFTHLTNFHEFKNTDPLQQLSVAKKVTIKQYLKSYHLFSINKDVTFNNVIPYIPQVAQKVSNNLNSYLNDLKHRRSN
jgi:hypothetical protein